jgi:hypothetical protein
LRIKHIKQLAEKSKTKIPLNLTLPRSCQRAGATVDDYLNRSGEPIVRPAATCHNQTSLEDVRHDQTQS